jgi:thiol-disulfide isomerase/thioredoxin
MVTLRMRTAWVLCPPAIYAAMPGVAHAQVAPGSAFPSLASAGLAGASLPETSGKVVLYDFWASWCAPCKASFPVYSRMQSDYAARGLVIVAVGVDDTASAFDAFVARMKPSFATVHDARHALVAAVQVPTMPTSYLVDRSGKVRFMHPGFRGDQTDRELRREIDALLAEKPPAPRDPP